MRRICSRISIARCEARRHDPRARHAARRHSIELKTKFIRIDPTARFCERDEGAGRDMIETRSTVADGMRIDWDVAIPMDDGIVLRADVFRPFDEGRHPVIMTLGPYAKGLAFQDTFYKGSWNNMIGKYPEIAQGSTN